MPSGSLALPVAIPFANRPPGRCPRPTDPVPPVPLPLPSRRPPPVAHRVARFNHEGLAALDPRHGGGHEPTYAAAARDRINDSTARGEYAPRLFPAQLASVPCAEQGGAGAEHPCPRRRTGRPWPLTTQSF